MPVARGMDESAAGTNLRGFSERASVANNNVGSVIDLVGIHCSQNGFNASPSSFDVVLLFIAISPHKDERFRIFTLWDEKCHTRYMKLRGDRYPTAHARHDVTVRKLLHQRGLL